MHAPLPTTNRLSLLSVKKYNLEFSDPLKLIWYLQKPHQTWLYCIIVLRQGIYFKTASSWRRKEAEVTPQKQLPTPTTPMTKRYWGIHPTRPKPYYIVWNEPPQSLASVSMHIKLNMRYNQTGDISPLGGISLKLVDKFTYLGSSVSSTDEDTDTRLTKAWTAIDKLSIIWRSDLTDEMKRSFFQAAVVSIMLYGCTTWTLTKRLEKKLDGNYTRTLKAILNKYWRQHPTRH